MAHEIDQTTGRAACMTAGAVPWHGLGVNVAEVQTSAEAIALAGLDWEVEQWPLFAARDGKQVRPATGWVANVRADTGAILGVVGSGYRPFQNREAFAFMDELVGEELALYETAGALKEGRRVWMLARIPQTLWAAGEDQVDPYILLTNGHDGGQALRMLATSVRVVCQNTLNLALNAAGAAAGLHVRHTGSLQDRVAEARANLGIITQRVAAFQREIISLSTHDLSGRESRDYFEQFFPVERHPEPRRGTISIEEVLAATAQEQEVVEELLIGHRELSERQVRANARILEQILENYERDPACGTAWGAYNAVSQYADHQKTVRGQTDLDRANSRLNSAWFGAANELKQEAYASALQLAGVG